MDLLVVKDLKKNFGSRQAVDGLSFSVSQGEVFGLLGPNGAGKSTTLSIIYGLLKPREGTVTINGWDISKERIKTKKMIGVVPQEPAIYPQLSAKANLKFWGKINGLSGKKLDRAVKRVLELVGLEDRANEKAGKYSGGMKRRLNIASGLIHNPKLLIMDEPTVGVDPQSRNHILETVKQLKDQGTTIIYTSHYVEEVEYLCDRVAIMDHGNLISQGPISELLNEAGEHQEILITLNSATEAVDKPVSSLPGVAKVFTVGNQIKILTGNAEQLLPLAFEAIVNQGLRVSQISINKPNLEGLFLKITGRALRD